MRDGALLMSGNASLHAAVNAGKSQPGTNDGVAAPLA